MKITELIRQLEEVKQNYGDVTCRVFQHQKEDESMCDISSLYIHKKENILHIS